MAAKMTNEQILKDADFLELTSKRIKVAIVLTVLELVLYFGFIFLVAYKKAFLAEKFSGAITKGIPIAVMTILLSWVFTGIYIWWANNTYDPMVKKVKDKIGV